MPHRQQINRRQFVQRSTLLALAAPSLLRGIEAAGTEFEDTPAIFRAGDPPIGGGWRRRLESDQATPLVRLLLSAATDRLADPVAPKNLAKYAPPTGVNDPSVQDYVSAGLPRAAMLYYAPMFALAHRLGDDNRFAARALEWIDAYTSWPSVEPGQGDIGESYAAMGSVVAAHWLGEDLLGAARRKALHETWTREGAALTRWHDNTHPNNHLWFTNAGLGFLAAMHPDCFKNADALIDRLIRTFRESLPAAFSAAGEYNDGVIYAWFTLTTAGLFAQALRDRRGVRLWDEQHLKRLRAFADFGLDTTCPDGANLPGEHEVIRGFNWMMARPVLSLIAAESRDADLLARMRGANDQTPRLQRGMKLWFWFRKNQPHPGEAATPTDVYWHGVFDLMWLPPAGPSKPLDAGPRIKRYPHTGTCIAREGLLGGKTMLHFRAGTASQKDMSDHNGFVWYPAGVRVIDTPRSNMDEWRDNTVKYFKDWNSFFGTSRAANIILVDGSGQRAPESWYVQGDREWLQQGKAPTTSRIVEEERLADGVRWVGEAQDAYPGQLKLWQRTVELRNWLNLTVTDHIETAKPVAKIDWILHTQGEWQGAGRKFTVTYEGVRVDVEFTAPANVTVAIEQTPIGQDRRRTSFLRATTKTGNGKTAYDVRMTARLIPSPVSPGEGVRSEE